MKFAEKLCVLFVETVAQRFNSRNPYNVPIILWIDVINYL